MREGGAPQTKLLHLYLQRRHRRCSHHFLIGFAVQDLLLGADERLVVGHAGAWAEKKQVLPELRQESRT